MHSEFNVKQLHVLSLLKISFTLMGSKSQLEWAEDSGIGSKRYRNVPSQLVWIIMHRWAEPRKCTVIGLCACLCVCVTLQLWFQISRSSWQTISTVDTCNNIGTTWQLYLKASIVLDFQFKALISSYSMITHLNGHCDWSKVKWRPTCSQQVAFQLDNCIYATGQPATWVKYEV